MEGALPAWRPARCGCRPSTVGLEGTDRLAALAARHDVAFLDAPVLGTKAPAEQGTLTVLACGPEALRGRGGRRCSTRSGRARSGSASGRRRAPAQAGRELVGG